MLHSCLLFHGPGARQAALDEAGRQGLLIHEPFGDDGLKVDEAREFVSLLLSPVPGSERGVVVAGPMDQTKGLKSEDAMLKGIEQFSSYVLPILWAFDLGGVKPTIRSRCLPVWAPATGYEEVDEEVEAVARELLSASIGGHYEKIPGLVARVGKKGSKRGREQELLAEVVDAMSSMVGDPKVHSLWERVREAARWRNPTPIEIISAFLESRRGI